MSSETSPFPQELRHYMNGPGDLSTDACSWMLQYSQDLRSASRDVRDRRLASEESSLLEPMAVETDAYTSEPFSILFPNWSTFALILTFLTRRTMVISMVI